ncbi:MAG: hypothetical protein H7Y03_05190 [Chitinophagaceae bacterium]|nr:hypothetical protein [Chitinophagaceae bacterium]
MLLTFLSFYSYSQVNTVEFGKNRVQFKKFKWAYYQTDNFNSFHSQNGEPLAKYVAQLAEKELPEIEAFTEYGLQRRANIIIYNHFNEMEQSNIGLNTDWTSITGGNTQFVNNKMIVYYNGDHQHLRLQVRQGLARILLDNILFGDDLGEFAANQTLLDLPKWLTDGYVAYAAQNWGTELDDQLKSAILSGSYKNFYQFAFEKPMLAGHSFWNYVADRYKKENVTYFLYLARVYRNLNGASQRITKMKFKDLLRQFMEENEEKYYKDIRARRNAPKGTMSVVEETSKYKDFFRFTPNPAPRSMTYAMVEFKRGISRVVLYENYVNRKVLLKNGVRSADNVPNPNYPMLAWDPKGSRLAVIYWAEGKTKLFVYDLTTRRKSIKLDLDEFDQIQDAKFMLDANTLLLSAVKKGQSDLFVFKIDKESSEQITNDVYDDLDASFVAFPNKTGILYSSNRPTALALTSDTALPSNNRYNVFLVDNWNKSEFKQISKLTDLKYGNARFPMQYNQAHFTFVSDENGIGNRYAGFFSSKRVGVDTVYKIGTELLRNPDPKDLDSTLRAFNKSEPDSIFSFALTSDSAYVFALTNYQSSLVETKIAGEKGVVSEVRQEGDLKFLYRLKVDENLLKRRNVNPRPTEYRRKTIDALRLATGDRIDEIPALKDTTSTNVFETEFENDKTSATTPVIPGITVNEQETSVLAKAKHYDYTWKFAVDQTTTSLFSNDVLITRYEPFTGSLPISPSGGGLNGLIKLGVIDMLEDLRFTGMFRLPLLNTAGAGVGLNSNGNVGFVAGTQSLFNSGTEYLGRVDYLKHRMDYSVVYYRKTDIGYDELSDNPMKLYTNLYQGIIKYPFDKVKSLRLSAGVRSDKFIYKIFDEISKDLEDRQRNYALLRLEYVYDNTITKATNIMNGLRYKIYGDFNSQINTVEDTVTKPQIGRNSFNLGFDGRYYYPIFRNFIWAGRVAGDFSWGDQKVLYYLGGVDGWLLPKADGGNRPQDRYYAYQALAVNMRGFNQNIANGNNALVINSEFRFPLFSTLFNRPINNAFLRNFQLIQFIDLGSAWNGVYNKIGRPTSTYVTEPSGPDLTNIAVKFKAGGIGPFVGGYGFGARSTLLGYFLRLDAGWSMDGLFRGRPILYFGMGVDF